MSQEDGKSLERRARISHEETERRLLAAAVEQVNAAGLTVSLEHLSFEAAIESAGVSRSTAYRRWPNKELFLRDLLLELARAATPREVVLGDSSWATIGELVLAEPERLPDPDFRRTLVSELFRTVSDLDFQLMNASAEWRTYLALHATYASLGEARLRQQVQEALAAAQQRFVASMAANWEQIAALLGFRLQSAEVGFQAGAELISASVRGMLVMSMADPAMAQRRVDADPFGTGTEQWSLVAFGCAALAASFLEPVPGLVWDAARTAALRAELEANPHRD